MRAHHSPDGQRALRLIIADSDCDDVIESQVPVSSLRPQCTCPLTASGRHNAYGFASGRHYCLQLATSSWCAQCIWVCLDQCCHVSLASSWSFACVGQGLLLMKLPRYHLSGTHSTILTVSLTRVYHPPLSNRRAEVVQVVGHMSSVRPQAAASTPDIHASLICFHASAF